ncbi:hypothetical protein ACSYAD_26320 [Acaryochloris marina NIES-2412]|uniref:hypothetical protein n=1 Tax=Acaryochloris marina TaxID=155978 RepID=UPI004058CECB
MDDISSFKIKFHSWLKDSVRQEVESDFRTLRQIKGELAIRSCYYFDSLDLQDRLNCLLSLSNKFLIDNGDIIDRQPSEKDRERWNNFEQFVFVNDGSLRRFDSLFTEEAIQERKKIDLHELRNQIHINCESSLGVRKRNSKKIIEYEFYVENFLVTTHIDLGGWHQLRYLHTIHYCGIDKTIRKLVLMTDFMSWIGIGSTSWEFISNQEDISNAATILGKLSKDFREGIELAIQ